MDQEVYEKHMRILRFFEESRVIHTETASYTTRYKSADERCEDLRTFNHFAWGKFVSLCK
jgi:hypothetical protein